MPDPRLGLDAVVRRAEALSAELDAADKLVAFLELAAPKAGGASA